MAKIAARRIGIGVARHGAGWYKVRAALHEGARTGKILKLWHDEASKHGNIDACGCFLMISIT
ncbi:MAG: hypothetical protein JSS16_04580 [Proteobacteria bacterium]|uniref:hypothetical protein n=1 Tax=Rudaea sp. TaxID=2136325 RepID=UPI001E10FD9A|nr:hypothetical protein [Pseudomonadota bacterium]MBS0567513.1 hypothetical protein [Pseudomonadota bacterium]